MKRKKSFRPLLATLFVAFIFISSHTPGQETNKLTIYESSNEMVAAAKKVITEIPVAEFKKIFDHENPRIIDVRTRAEHKAGAIPGAVNIPRGILEFYIHQEETWSGSDFMPPLKTDPFFVYCSTGGRGALSTLSLMQLGYKNVQSIQGGWNAWNEAYPDLKN
jgi:rhodanese-related sulfurtransferase